MAINAELKLLLFMMKIPPEMVKIGIQHLSVRVRQPKETSQIGSYKKKVLVLVNDGGILSPRVFRRLKTEISPVNDENSP